VNDDSVHGEHTDVGAYALGLLDEAGAARFEEHLAGCVRCAEELEANLGLGAVLREAAEADDRLRESPDDGLLVRLLTEAGRDRRRARCRRRLLAGAAAAAVLAAGAATVPAVTGQDGGAPPSAATARAAFQQGEEYADRDPATDVRATVSLQQRPWGTHVALRIGNLTGPRTCDLIAVGEDGTRHAVTSWSVPGYGYGLEGTAYGEPLYVQGGAALTPDRIDHFEVRTPRGERLAVIRL
jgi:hypothetical protein